MADKLRRFGIADVPLEELRRYEWKPPTPHERAVKLRARFRALLREGRQIEDAQEWPWLNATHFG